MFKTITFEQGVTKTNSFKVDHPYKILNIGICFLGNDKERQDFN